MTATSRSSKLCGCVAEPTSALEAAMAGVPERRRRPPMSGRARSTGTEKNSPRRSITSTRATGSLRPSAQPSSGIDWNGLLRSGDRQIDVEADQVGIVGAQQLDLVDADGVRRQAASESARGRRRQPRSRPCRPAPRCRAGRPARRRRRAQPQHDQRSAGGGSDRHGGNRAHPVARVADRLQLPVADLLERLQGRGLDVGEAALQLSPGTRPDGSTGFSACSSSRMISAPGPRSSCLAGSASAITPPPPHPASGRAPVA